MTVFGFQSLFDEIWQSTEKGTCLMSTEHTPTPWTYQQSLTRDDRYWVKDANGATVAGGLPLEVATFIVRACNAHDGLVEALEGEGWLVRRCQDVLTAYLVPDGYGAYEAINKLLSMLDGPEQRVVKTRSLAALAAARGETETMPLEEVARIIDKSLGIETEPDTEEKADGQDD